MKLTFLTILGLRSLSYTDLKFLYFFKTHYFIARCILVAQMIGPMVIL